MAQNEKANIPTAPKKSSKTFFIVLIVLVIAGGWFGTTKYLHAQHHEETDNAQIESNISPVIPRVAGYVFNPVSFWHCHDAAGQLRAVLAEVNNTFGESHRYLMRIAHTAGGSATATADKQMHVSPFCEVKGHYRFRFRLDGASHCTGLDYHDGDGVLLRTALSGRPVPMTDSALAGALLRYPLLGLGIVFRIHWQAFRLWLKHVPFFSKPPAPSHQTTVHQEPAR